MNFLSKSKTNFAIPVVAENFNDIKEQINEINQLENIDIIEIRLDKITETIDENLLNLIRELTEKKLIATFRCELDKGRLKSFSKERINYLILSAKSGFDIIDFEYNRLRKTQINDYSEEIKKINQHCKIIISYHDFKKNIKYGVVKNIIKDMKKLCKPNLIKFAFRVDNRNNLKNFVRMLFDFKRMNNLPISLIGLGKYSKLCRVLAEYFNQNLIFLSLKTGLESAKGQLSYSNYFEIINVLED
jgi:3-dehydroquinate dehydratase type I